MRKLRANPYTHEEVLGLVEKIESEFTKRGKVYLSDDEVLMICERLRTLLNMEQYVALLEIRIEKLKGN
jgi:hypothetical protein